MKTITLYINESLVKSKPTGEFNKFKYHPKKLDDLINAIQTELENGNENLNCIDTSDITDMSFLFAYKRNNFDFSKIENLDISGWNVSNVTDMQGMFYSCAKFNCDLSTWDVSKVTNMNKMFYNCTKFEGKGLENWDVSKVRNMCAMFSHCTNFNYDGVSQWNVSNVKTMNSMFSNCINLNIDISQWDVHNVENAEMMFIGCKLFNCDLSKWDLHNAQFTYCMFAECPLMSKQYDESPDVNPDGKLIHV